MVHGALKLNIPNPCPLGRVPGRVRGLLLPPLLRKRDLNPLLYPSAVKPQFSKELETNVRREWVRG